MSPHPTPVLMFLYYYILGGLAAVIFTDTLQTIIMLTGAISLSVLGSLSDKKKNQHKYVP